MKFARGAFQKNCLVELVRIRRGDSRGDDWRGKPRRHRALPVADERDLPVFVHSRDGFIGGGEFCPSRHVALGAVAVFCADGELLRAVLRQLRALRRNGKLHELRIIRRRRGRACGDPRGDGAIVVVAHAEPFAALVLDGHRGLREKQAAAGIGGLDAATERLARDRLPVGLWVVSKLRKPKSALARERAVAAAAVAVGFAENRKDVVAEGWGVFCVCTRDDCGEKKETEAH